MIEMKVSELKVGNLVNLEGDEYADPNRDNPSFPYELVEVIEIIHETENCILLGYEGGLCGFPPDHIVKVERV